MKDPENPQDSSFETTVDIESAKWWKKDQCSFNKFQQIYVQSMLALSVRMLLETSQNGPKLLVDMPCRFCWLAIYQ